MLYRGNNANLSINWIAILFCILNTSNSIAMEFSERDFIHEETMLLLGEELVITATKHPRQARKAPSIVTVISAEQIRETGARNLMDVLKIVPGLGVYIARYGQGEIAVRGIRTSGTEKVRVMVDGHRINEYFMGSAMTLHDDIEIDNIKRVEVIRGPGSALYGENAFVAVINIITKDAEDVNGTELKAAVGTFNTEKYNVTFGQKIGDFEIAGAITHSETRGPKLKVEEDAFGLSGETNFWKEKLDLNLKLAYSNLITRDDKLRFNSKYTRRERADYIGLIGALNDEADMEIYQFFGELSYSHRAGDKIGLIYKIYYDLFEEDVLFELDNQDSVPVIPNYIDARMSNQALGFEGQMDYEILSNSMITFGFVLESRRQFDIELLSGDSISTMAVDPGNWNNEGDTRDIWALYLQDEWEIVPDLNLTLGGRYDYYSDFGGTINPRGGLVWEFVEGGSLKVLHGWAFRAPNSREMFDRNNVNTAGNEDLDPETIKTTEVGLHYQFGSVFGGGITYFYNHIRDLIIEEATPPGSATLFKFENKGGVEIHGLETEVRAVLAPATYIWGNYSLQQAKDSDTGEILPDVPNQKFVAGLNVGWWKYLNANFYVVGESKFSRARNDTRNDVPEYAIANLTLIAKEFFQTLQIRGSVYNLLDEDYKYSSPTGTVPSDFPQPGREYMIEVIYKF